MVPRPRDRRLRLARSLRRFIGPGVLGILGIAGLVLLTGVGGTPGPGSSGSGDAPGGPNASDGGGATLVPT
ncbi:MAG: hypothetical protein FIA92_11310, partial [Chloroflexi bacterium]|nr:hypothetical protein [Chloroflexota bacterium]